MFFILQKNLTIFYYLFITIVTVVFYLDTNHAEENFFYFWNIDAFPILARDSSHG